MTEISVIIPARDASATIAATMRALEAQTGDYEVIVVDDGSQDRTAELARSSSLEPTVVELTEARGPGNARNAGVAVAKGSLLAFTDADCEPEPGWLAAGLRHAGRADLIQGVVTPAARFDPFDRTIAFSRETGLYETSNLFVSKETFERVGGFSDFVDPANPHGFGEDAEFGWRCRRSGARTSFAEDAVVRHAVFPRGPSGYVKERWRRSMFPLLVKKIPELRGFFLYRRVFLTRRTAAFDLACLGGVVAALLGSPWPALAAAPYLGLLAVDAGRWRKRAPIVAVVELAADAVGLGALLYGSGRWRALVL
jgi:glycosyltransferase involved in cell wall biosynthesis